MDILSFQSNLIIHIDGDLMNLKESKEGVQISNTVKTLCNDKAFLQQRNSEVFFVFF